MRQETQHRRFGTILSLMSLSSPLSRSPGLKRRNIVIGSAQPQVNASACPLRRNGNGPLAAEMRTNSSPGAMLRHIHCRIIRNDGRKGRSRSVVMRQMDLVFTIFARTFTSGAVIGIRRITTQSRRNEIHAGLNQPPAALLVEAPGGTTSKWHVALRVPASLRSSDTRTTAFVSRAISRTHINTLPFAVKSFTDTSNDCKVLLAC